MGVQHIHDIPAPHALPMQIDGFLTVHRVGGGAAHEYVSLLPHNGGIVLQQCKTSLHISDRPQKYLISALWL